MKKYEKPQIEICHVAAASTMLNLSVHNEEGNGIQRVKRFEFEEDEDEEDDY